MVYGLNIAALVERQSWTKQTKEKQGLNEINMMSKTENSNNNKKINEDIKNYMTCLKLRSKCTFKNLGM